jgi:hypothetical protein
MAAYALLSWSGYRHPMTGKGQEEAFETRSLSPERGSKPAVGERRLGTRAVFDPRRISLRRPTTAGATRDTSPAPQPYRPSFLLERSQCLPACGNRRVALPFDARTSEVSSLAGRSLECPVFGKGSFRGRPPHPIAVSPDAQPDALARVALLRHRSTEFFPWPCGPFLAIAARQNSRAPGKRGC